MSASVTVNATALERKLARLALLSKKDLPDLLKEGARRFAQNAVRNTPPMILSSSPAAARREWTKKVTLYFETHRVTKAGYRKDAELRRLLAAKKKQLGREAAGWNAAAQDLKATRIPSWVARHGEGEGYCNIVQRGDRCTIVMINRVPYNEDMTRRRAEFALERTERGYDGALKAYKRKLIRSLR